MTDDDFRDYRSQLDDLRVILEGTHAYGTNSYHWYGIQKAEAIELRSNEIDCFDEGGYFLMNDQFSKTMIRCGAYKDRPAQSDNLHMDIWVDGKNYLWDIGSYKYNTSEDLMHYFTGTEGHNTISIDGKDQMLKGSRFIWYNWIKEAKASVKKENKKFIFNGKFKGFKELGPNIFHKRKVEKKENEMLLGDP